MPRVLTLRLCFSIVALITEKSKNAGDVVKPIKTECWRITALLLCSLVGSVSCCSVYMPTDYGTMESFVEYADVCSKLSVLFDDSDATTLLVAGDFNCGVNMICSLNSAMISSEF